MLIEKAESPYIYCTLKLVEDNTSIQGIVRAAKHLPEPNAVVEEHVRIGLTTKNGKASYSLNGKTFTSVVSLASEVLVKIRETVNQDPEVVRAITAKQAFEAEMKRGVKAMDADWNRNLKARQKRDARADNGAMQKRAAGRSYISGPRGFSPCSKSAARARSAHTSCHPRTHSTPMGTGVSIVASAKISRL